MDLFIIGYSSEDSCKHTNSCESGSVCDSIVVMYIGRQQKASDDDNIDCGAVLGP